MSFRFKYKLMVSQRKIFSFFLVSETVRLHLTEVADVLRRLLIVDDFRNQLLQIRIVERNVVARLVVDRFVVEDFLNGLENFFLWQLTCERVLFASDLKRKSRITYYLFFSYNNIIDRIFKFFPELFTVRPKSHLTKLWKC